MEEKHPPQYSNTKMSETHENTPTPAPEEYKPDFHEKRKWVIVRRISRFIGRTLGIFVLLFLFLAAIIQIPAVQHWTIEKTTTFLSRELNTKVAIGDFRLDFFDEISIGNVYMGNQNAPNDTLLSVERLRIDFNYWNLAWQIVQLDAIKLENAKVRLRRDIGQYDDNFQFIIDYFDPPKKEKSPFAKQILDIRFGQIHLRDIDFIKDDKVRGQLLDIKLLAADIHTNIINLPNNIMDLTRVNIYKPYVHITETVGNPLPKKLLTNLKTEVLDSIPTVQVTQGSKDEEKDFQFLVGAISTEGGILKLDNWDRAK